VSYTKFLFNEVILTAMRFKIIMPDKSETVFEDKESAFKSAKEQASKLNKVIAIQVSKDGFNWEQMALVYPNGTIQEGTGGFGFFKRLPVGRVR